ncbi:hypothetical protein M758_UG216700 [Ceratodon purpureus]|nr:hypothetical protein M758_UG216700 [Ceratodon purpureus]
MELLTKKYVDFELCVGAMRMQEARVEFMKREYELEKAVTRHVRTMKGVDGSGGVPPRDELEALKKKGDVEALYIKAKVITREKGAEIHLVEYEIITLERVLSVWVEDPSGRAGTLFRHSTSFDITEAFAFQMAGLDCRCMDANCDFPFVVDDCHRHRHRHL